MANQMPVATAAYQVYSSGQKFIGTATVDLPTLTQKTAEVQGAGIAGSASHPVTGMFDSMIIGLNFPTITEDNIRLLKETQQIECWGAVEFFDAGTGKRVVKQHKIVTRAVFKALTIGKFGPSETQDRKLEFEVVYLKEEYDGKEHIEIDKYNYVYRVDGEDMLADVRAAIGV